MALAFEVFMALSDLGVADYAVSRHHRLLTELSLTPVVLQLLDKELARRHDYTVDVRRGLLSYLSLQRLLTLEILAAYNH